MDWKKVVGTIAPFIGAAIPGPFGQMAVGAIGNALGLDKPTVQSVQKFIEGQQLTPEQALALKQADNDFQVKMTQLGYDNVEKLEALSSADRDSARNREIQVKDRTPKVLAYAVTFGFFVVFACIVKWGVSDKAHDAVVLLLGTLGAAWTGVIAYYFGSSSGSAAKTDAMAETTAALAKK